MRSFIINKLQQGCQFYNLVLSEKQLQQLATFLLLIEKWNKVHNLTAIRKVEDMVTKHLLDSLSVVPFLPKEHGARILDVGTGAGLPGVPLTIVRSDLEFILIDSNNKKVSFIQEVIDNLQLNNVSVFHTRIENFQPIKQNFKIIISRAFSELGKFVSCCTHLCDINTSVIAMKGKIQQVQKESLPESFLLTKIESVKVPELKEERCLAFVIKQNK